MIEAADAISYMRRDQVEIIANELGVRSKRTPEYLLDLANRPSHL